MQHTCKLNKTAICKSSYAQLEIRMFPPTYIRASVVVRVRSLHTVVRALTACQRMYAVRGQQVLQQVSQQVLSQVSLSSITLRPGHVPTHMQQTRSFSLSYARTFARSGVGTAARYAYMYVCMYVCITSVPSAGHTAQHSTVHMHCGGTTPHARCMRDKTRYRPWLWLWTWKVAWKWAWVVVRTKLYCTYPNSMEV